MCLIMTIRLKYFDAGLDPAQPCFDTEDLSMKLDPSDAVLVDVIHTNGKLMNMLGFGVPNPLGKFHYFGCNST